MRYDPQKPVPYVKDCGRQFSDIIDRRELYSLKSELTDKELKSKYARYFQMGPVMPSEENIIATEPDSAMNPARAFMIEDYPKMMDTPACSDITTGYCVMDNGVGFSAARTFMPGCTAEIMSNFIANFNPEEDLYYKAWLPGAHIRHYADMAVEDVGFGMVQLRFIEGLNAQSIGMPEKRGDIYNIGITGANILCVPLHQPEAQPLYVSELCYYRLLPDGYEQRVMFWIGMHFKNGKSVLKLPGGKPVPEYIPAALARHSAWETATFMRNVMAFWDDTQSHLV